MSNNNGNDDVPGVSKDGPEAADILRGNMKEYVLQFTPKEISLSSNGANLLPNLVMHHDVQPEIPHNEQSVSSIHPPSIDRHTDGDIVSGHWSQEWSDESRTTRQRNTEHRSESLRTSVAENRLNNLHDDTPYARMTKA